MLSHAMACVYRSDNDKAAQPRHPPSLGIPCQWPLQSNVSVQAPDSTSKLHPKIPRNQDLNRVANTYQPIRRNPRALQHAATILLLGHRGKAPPIPRCPAGMPWSRR